MSASRPLSLLYKYGSSIADYYVMPTQFTKTNFEVKHYPANPLVSASRFTSSTNSYLVTLPPTALATDETSIYKALVECFDGHESNFVMDLRDPEIRNTMQYLHYWSEKRIKFVLAHEMAHIVNDDFGSVKLMRRKFHSSLGNTKALRALNFEEEHEADSLAVAVDAEHALGGIEHMLKLQKFFDFIYQCSVKTGNKMTYSEFLEARSKTHPIETERLERMYRIIASKYDITQLDAMNLAMQNAGEDILPGIKVQVPTLGGEYNEQAQDNISNRVDPKILEAIKPRAAASASVDKKTLQAAQEVLKNMGKKRK